MHIADNSLFTSFIMTEEEEIRGMQFNLEQRAKMMNLRTAAAEEIVTHVVTPISGTDYDKMAQARLKGQIEILDLLLAGPLQSETQEGN